MDSHGGRDRGGDGGAGLEGVSCHHLTRGSRSTHLGGCVSVVIACLHARASVSARTSRERCSRSSRLFGLFSALLVISVEQMMEGRSRR